MRKGEIHAVVGKKALQPGFPELGLLVKLNVFYVIQGKLEQVYC